MNTVLERAYYYKYNTPFTEYFVIKTPTHFSTLKNNSEVIASEQYKNFTVVSFVHRQ